MANEATIGCSLRIRSGNINYTSAPSTFRADVSESTGPTPGEISVGQYGVNVSLTNITTPGLCRIQNRSDTWPVLVGIHDGLIFFPLMEILPTECYVIRLWRHLGDELTGTGTGTPSDDNRFHLKSVGGTARVCVEVFGK